MSTTPVPTCASCGAASSGPFCAECGASTSGRTCGSCKAALSGTARFCHRCGQPAAGGASAQTDRNAWLVVAAITVLTIGLTTAKLLDGGAAAPAIAEMGNAGNASAGGVVRAPDISQLSPRERFDRLFERVVSAAERQLPDTVLFFAPMALNAYGQLAQVDADARYHAAMIHLVVGEYGPARALADTILAETPGHLFGTLIRGEIAEAGGDAAALTTSYAAFRAAWDPEMAAGRPEYAEHRAVLEDFRNRATARRTP
jgi:hypothetical protein